MATVRDVVTSALKELGVLAQGEIPTTDDASDGLVALNRLMDGWAAERLQIFTVTRTTWTITPSDAMYSVGTGGDVNVARPVFVNQIQFIDTNTNPDLEYPLSLLTDEMFAGIRLKDQENQFPASAYYNPTFPLATITFWPVPTGSGLKGVLYAPQAVAQFASLDTAISLPPGYERMLVKNLAMELAPAYERDVDAALARQAIESKETVKRGNRRLYDLSFDAGALIQGRYYPYGWGFNIFQG